MIPKVSDPLAKDIRTGEGLLEWAAGVVLVVAAASSSLSWWHSSLGIMVVTLSKSLRRGSIKRAAVQVNTTLGIAAPIVPDLPVLPDADADALPDLAVTDPATIPPDQGDARPAVPPPTGGA